MGTVNDEELQVTLEVLDKNNSVVKMYLLPVEDVTIEISRQPIVFIIPSGPTDPGNFLNNRPIAYALDLSMMNEMMILSGVSVDNEEDAKKPSAHQLREVARTHWFGMIPTFENGKPKEHGGIRLTLNEGAGQGEHAYQGVIVNLTTNRKGGQPRWEWKLTSQIFYWPLDMAP